MRTTIIIETNGHKDNYVEWDMVLVKPVSITELDKRKRARAGDQELTYYCNQNWHQEHFLQRWKELYWDKYLLWRIQYVHPWNCWPRCHIDFIRLLTWKRWCTYKPLGWQYSYFDSMYVDIIKCVDASKIYTSLDYKQSINKLLTSKSVWWIPISNIVFRTWASKRRADFTNISQEALANKIITRRIERETIGNTPATPEEVLKRNVYPV